MTARAEYHAQTLPLMTLIDAADMGQRVLERRLWSVGLSVPQQFLLERFLLSKEPLTPSTLAALVLCETHTMSGLLNRLEARGLVTRGWTKEDRRKVWVSLTPAGREAAIQGRRVARKALMELGKELDGPDASDALDAVMLIRHIGFKVAGIRMEKRKEALRRGRG